MYRRRYDMGISLGQKETWRLSYLIAFEFNCGIQFLEMLVTSSF